MLDASTKPPKRRRKTQTRRRRVHMIFKPRDKWIRAVQFDPAKGTPPGVVSADGIWLCRFTERGSGSARHLEVNPGDWIVRDEQNTVIGVLDKYAMAALFAAIE